MLNIEKIMKIMVTLNQNSSNNKIFYIIYILFTIYRGGSTSPRINYILFIFKKVTKKIKKLQYLYLKG